MVELNIKLPENFLDEEERCGYIVEKKMKEVWAVELDLLNEFKRVCKKHNIMYFADGGTILGAVRHKGFIPWDDDIDLAMTREEYNKLCSHADEFKYPYFFQTNYNDPGSLRGHAQLRNCATTGALKNETNSWINQGIFIDIFPIDNVTDDNEKFSKQIKKIAKFKKKAIFWGRNLYFTESSNNIKKAVKEILYKVKIEKIARLLEKKYYKKMEKICQKYNTEKSKNCSLLSFQCEWKRLIREREDYKEAVMMPFEFVDMPIPIGYEKVLTNLYGDYNKIVVNSSAHGDVIFDTETSYKQFLKDKYENKFY